MYFDNLQDVKDYADELQYVTDKYKKVKDAVRDTVLPSKQVNGCAHGICCFSADEPGNARTREKTGYRSYSEQRQPADDDKEGHRRHGVFSYIQCRKYGRYRGGDPNGAENDHAPVRFHRSYGAYGYRGVRSSDEHIDHAAVDYPSYMQKPRSPLSVVYC